MIKFKKCDPLADGSFTIILKGEDLTIEDRVRFIHLSDKPITIVEEQQMDLTNMRDELLRNIKDSLNHLEKLWEGEQK